MRDTRADRAHFDHVLASMAEYLDADTNLALYHGQGVSAHGIKDTSSLMYAYTEDWLETTAILYSRGDDLDEIRTLRIEEGMNRYRYVAAEIEKNKDNPDKLFFYEDLGFPTQLGSVYTWLAWFICFKADEGFLKEIAPTLAYAGHDRLVDTIFARYDPARTIAPDSAYPRSYQLLDDLIDANDADREKLVKKYLKNWCKFMAATGSNVPSMGVYLPKGIKSNKALMETPTDSAYHGYWAWEVALVVQFFSIDDSSFKDHPLYPRDLVAYARS